MCVCECVAEATHKEGQIEREVRKCVCVCVCGCEREREETKRSAEFSNEQLLLPSLGVTFLSHYYCCCVVFFSSLAPHTLI